MAASLTARQILERLVAIDSTSHRSNLELAEWIADYLDRPGTRSERLLSADGQKCCLQIRVGPQTDPARRDGLVLCGHMDTVPAGDSGWTSDPFRLDERDRRWYARGACDMKGFLALAIELAAGLDGGRLQAPLVLLFTYDEEVGALGAQRLVETAAEREPLPRATIIGEPTSLRAVRMHKGSARLRLEVTGESAHGGYPHLGDNAVVSAARAVSALDRLAGAWRAARPARSEFFPEVPYVALNIGTIDGGAAVNVVPDRCVVGFGLRPLPGMAAADLVAEVERELGTALEPGRWSLRLENEIPALLVDESAPIYRVLTGMLGQSRSYGVSYASDGGPLQSLDLDCVLYGPGSIEIAHQPDEYVPAEEMAAASKILARLARATCAAGADA